SICIGRGKSVVDTDITPLRPSKSSQALAEPDEPRLHFRIALRATHQHPDAPHALGLLRARRQRPSRSRAANERDELAALHSRTSLARATNTSDRETPSN